MSVFCPSIFVVSSLLCQLNTLKAITPWWLGAYNFPVSSPAEREKSLLSYEKRLSFVGSGRVPLT